MFPSSESSEREGNGFYHKCEKRIVVGGIGGDYQLGEPPNSKRVDGFGVIAPPVNLSIDPSSLLSHSVYGSHSIVVTRSGSLRGVGSNSSGEISSLLEKKTITQFTKFVMKDENGQTLTPVSAVCTSNGTLYMFTKSCGKGRQLVLCDFEKKQAAPSIFQRFQNFRGKKSFGYLARTGTASLSAMKVAYLGVDRITVANSELVKEQVKFPRSQRLSHFLGKTSGQLTLDTIIHFLRRVKGRYSLVDPTLAASSSSAADQVSETLICQQKRRLK